jgi:putative copper export protein
MLPVHVATVRLFLHVLAAAVWVGGQLTLAGLLPAVRKLGPDAPRSVARAFNRVAWPAFGVLVATGIWNVAAAAPSGDTAYDATLALKIVVVVVAGGALGALFLGVLLAGS